VLSRRFHPPACILAALLAAALPPPSASAEPDTVPLGTGAVTVPPPDSASGIRPTDLFRIGARVYDTGGLQFAVRTKALAVAAQILENAGLGLDWSDCPAVLPTRPRREPDPRCAAAAGASDLVIRLQRGSTQPSERAALGYSLIDAGRGGVFATVFVDRVEWLAGRAGTRADVLLGRAIAHELGHLLLGSTGHAEWGLMRAVWTAGELAIDRPDDWLFSPGDRQRVRESRLARAREPGTPHAP
jgi:hypothetical protein